MSIVYTLQIYEEMIQPRALCQISSIESAFDEIYRALEDAKHDVTVVIREHYIENPCDICSSKSDRRVITLYYPKN